ncbi:hypothetical protein [Flavobacterium sp. HJSW_4]|uniref:hypothetical protein n=1 Tax=Flavobacterium sp. HJSW_4 TaxID=3344660 RepID=UPI0035F4B50E
MIAESVMYSGALKRNAVMQSLMLLENYPELHAWLSKLFEANEFNSTIAFNAESRLTAKGVPIEYAIVWPSHSVRCTVDVLPHRTAKERIARTLDLAGSFGNAFQQDICNDLLQQQEEKMLRYGAWLGVREGEDKVNAKLYLEVADTCKPDFFDALKLSYDLLKNFGVKPVMLGLPMDKGGVEIYFKLAKLDRPFMKWLLAYFGFPDRTQEIFGMLEEFCESSLSGSLDWSSLGFSIAWSSEKKMETVTFYSFASSAIGSDKNVRKHVMRIGQRHNWDMALYSKLSEEANGDTDLNTFHGMVGVVAGTKGELHFTAGISPVDVGLL